MLLYKYNKENYLINKYFDDHSTNKGGFCMSFYDQFNLVHKRRRSKAYRKIREFTIYHHWSNVIKVLCYE